MDNLFLIIGVVLFTAATIAVWAKAYKKSMGWGVVTMVFPVACLPFYYMEWRKTRVVAGVHILGLGFIGAGFLLYAKDHPGTLSWFQTQTEEVFAFDILEQKTESLFSANLAPARGDRRVLSGNTAAGPFLFEQGVYRNGTLRLSNGSAFYNEQEIAIQLSVPLEKLYSGLHLSVRPEDLEAPSLSFSRSNKRSAIPETVIYTSGYWMELDMDIVEQNELRGFVQILFPDSNHIVAGEYVAYSNDLRYVYGKLDRGHNSSETIEVISREVVAAYHGRNPEFVKVKNARIYEDQGGVVASSVAQFRDQENRFREVKVTLNKLSGIWLAEAPYDRATLLAKANDIIRDEAPGAIESRAMAAPSSKPQPTEIEVDVFVEKPDEYIGRELEIETAYGSKQRGKLQRVTATKIVLIARVGNGEAEYFLPLDELKSVIVFM